MLGKNLKKAAFFLSIAASVSLNAIELQDMGSVSVNKLIDTLVSGDPNIKVFNATWSGDNASIGVFKNASNDGIGIDSGVILTSGSIYNAKGPNNSDGKSKSFGGPGDALLTEMVGVSTYDATVLEFDFISKKDTIAFQYVFASEEYNEYVGQYNDVFGFFLDGKNIALVPGSNDVVSINNINKNKNSAYFHNNDPSELKPPPYNIQYDGFTSVLVAKAKIEPNVVHHLKLVIADAKDSALDSAVFLKGKSFSTEVPPPVVATDCQSATVDDYFNNTCVPGQPCNLVFTKQTVDQIVAKKLQQCKEDPASCGIFASGSVAPEDTPDSVVINAVKNKLFPINGYYINYGKKAYDWLYVPHGSTQVYKLEKGLDSKGQLRWNLIEGLTPFVQVPHVMFK